jgi:hypothetical protein
MVFSKSESSRPDIGSNNDEGDEEGIGKRNSAKYLYHDSTWNQGHFMYEPKNIEFIGISAPNVFCYQFPTFL